MHTQYSIIQMDTHKHTSKSAHTHYRSAVLAVILSPLDIVPSDRIARIPEEPQCRHMGDTQGLSFRVEVGLNDVVLSKVTGKSDGVD